jgi:hypothetical protein
VTNSSLSFTKYLKDTSTAADLRCTIVKGIQKWFLTDNTNESDEPDPTTQLGWFQVIKDYLPNQSSITQAKIFRDQGLDTRYNTGDQRTSQLIIFFRTQSHTLWKDRCKSANAATADNLDNSSARTRQTAQNHMTMAYANNPLMLAIDRRIFDVSLEERIQSRTFNLVAWTKTMLRTVRHSISEAQNQLRTGHQDIRTYFSDTVALERNKNATQCSPSRQRRLLPLPQSVSDLAQPTVDSEINRQEQQRLLPLSQTVSDLAQPTVDSEINRQETGPLRLQPPFADPDLTTYVITSLPRQRQ